MKMGVLGFTSVISFMEKSVIAKYMTCNQTNIADAFVIRAAFLAYCIKQK